MRPTTLTSLVMGLAALSLSACGSEVSARPGSQPAMSATARSELAKKEMANPEVAAKKLATQSVEARKSVPARRGR
jgi:hypothetical protein